jgi:hypothetical protein
MNVSWEEYRVRKVSVWKSTCAVGKVREKWEVGTAQGDKKRARF